MCRSGKGTDARIGDCGHRKAQDGAALWVQHMPLIGRDLSYRVVVREVSAKSMGNVSSLNEAVSQSLQPSGGTLADARGDLKSEYTLVASPSCGCIAALVCGHFLREGERAGGLCLVECCRIAMWLLCRFQRSWGGRGSALRCLVRSPDRVIVAAIAPCVRGVRVIGLDTGEEGVGVCRSMTSSWSVSAVKRMHVSTRIATETKYVNA